MTPKIDRLLGNPGIGRTKQFDHITGVDHFLPPPWRLEVSCEDCCGLLDLRYGVLPILFPRAAPCAAPCETGAGNDFHWLFFLFLFFSFPFGFDTPLSGCLVISPTFMLSYLRRTLSRASPQCSEETI
ncbi:hypothetical protein P168DRAFT_172496 [Aspergillus campestris IBT 28561]|uniref:Uncharacterized protein n=1 Tax=Aspergillus campestris (strain IBT 28561) TaxID=1392248 RepID=A0A2I1D297_ASPC2|nr:uncharacterized protein P168DRAFT_172496 [Aspergillus campestris IBT 28561]PKY03968.1 hypothetical protein P168DRAFT_172496 [Aspergillus campestris IBT 28561]